MKKPVQALAPIAILLAFYSCSPANPADHGLTESDIQEYRADSTQFYELASERRELAAYVDSFNTLHEKTVVRDGYVVSGLNNLLSNAENQTTSYTIALQQKNDDKEAVLLMIRPKQEKTNPIIQLKDTLPGYRLYVVDSLYISEHLNSDSLTLKLVDYNAKKSRLNLVRSQIDFLREKWLGYLK